MRRFLSFAAQQAHHRERSFPEELRRLVERYELKRREEVETVGSGFNAGVWTFVLRADCPWSPR